MSSRVSIERIENRSVVSLKVSRASLEGARETLQLASPLSIAGRDPQSLWLGPDHWLLVSNSMTPESIVTKCDAALADVLHNAVDQSAGLGVLRIVGPNARQLLATGSGMDFRPEKFPAGTCCRTRLAEIAAVLVAEAPERFAVYVDRSYGDYLIDWLTDAWGIIAHAAAFQGLSPRQQT